MDRAGRRGGLLAAAVAAALLAAAPAGARSGLYEDGEIHGRLVLIGAADELREACSSVGPRVVPALAYLRGLQARALEKGYTRSEIEAYVEDDAEEERLRAIARRMLAEKGAREGDEASFCRVAAAEIAAGSPIGRLLRHE